MSGRRDDARIGPGSEKTSSNQRICEATANATTMPRNIAMPPRRGVGRVCTSRSRILG